jgi:UDP-3-O-[3-hydroxymyristoyl] glucosamine N-acyltransferase
VLACLGDLSELLGGELVGDRALTVSRIASLENAGSEAITFLVNPRHQALMQACQAACVIVGPSMREAAVSRGAAIVCVDPYLAYARLTQWWVAQQQGIVVGSVHASAVVETGAVIHASATVGALSFIATGARIEAGAVVGAQGFVGAGAVVGEHTVLRPRVTVHAGCRIGQRGILHSGVVIGADGFGFAPHEGAWVKIEQLGAVLIGDDVEIGANTCIDRGALDDTVIEDGVKIDNLVQIGHNVRIGAYTAMAGCTGVAGSARIGRHCTIGGAAIILGHLQIADHTQITAATVVSRSIHKAGQYSGAFPFDDNASWEKNAATLRQLHSLRERLRALEKKV